MFLEIFVIYCLEQQPQIYFVYSSWLELAVEKFEAIHVFF